ncbi:MAG TPA: EAL domain-containing protein [Thermoleophilaceae bacterium]
MSVLIADEDREFRGALAEIVDRTPSLDLVGTAGDTVEAIGLARLLRPDVVLVDVWLDEDGGPRVASELTAHEPGIRVLALSAYDDRGTIVQMFDAGAAGYLLKGSSGRELVEAIRATAHGDKVLSPEATAELSPGVRLRAGARPRPVSVVIADDNPDFLDALAATIERQPGFTVVGKASDVQGAIRLATIYQPDLALVDWRMPGGGGEEAATELAGTSPGTRVVALSAPQELETVVQMRNAGVTNYAVRSVNTGELVRILRETAARGSAPSALPTVPPGPIDALVLQAGSSGNGHEPEEERFWTVGGAIEDSAFEIAFQPIVDIASRRPLGVEALARFRSDPPRTPDVWFADAAAAGLGTELDMAAAEKALRILPALPPGVDLFLNVRPDSIHSDRFASLMALARSESVVIELTEHAPVRDYDALRATIGALRDVGFRVAVDDVGAGCSSFRHLLNLRPDVLKIDIAVCRCIESDRARQLLAGALVSLGREIGATVVAEGVETAAELRALRDLGVDGVQGFLTGAPTEAPLEEKLAAARV